MEKLTTMPLIFILFTTAAYGQNETNTDPSEQLIQKVEEHRNKQKQNDSLLDIHHHYKVKNHEIIVCNLKGRKLVSIPLAIADSDDEEIVVVEIVVDEKGNVIKAKPGLQGTTTSNSRLLAKARMAAIKLKFNESIGTIEQTGSYTFIFTRE